MLAVECWNAALEEGQSMSTKYMQQLSSLYGTEQISLNVLHIYYTISVSWIFGKFCYLNFNVKLRTVALTWFYSSMYHEDISANNEECEKQDAVESQ